jgi:hypothetical protein
MLIWWPQRLAESAVNGDPSMRIATSEDIGSQPRSLPRMTIRAWMMTSAAAAIILAALVWLMRLFASYAEA